MGFIFLTVSYLYSSFLQTYSQYLTACNNCIFLRSSCIYHCCYNNASVAVNCPESFHIHNHDRIFFFYQPFYCFSSRKIVSVPKSGTIYISLKVRHYSCYFRRQLGEAENMILGSYMVVYY